MDADLTALQEAWTREYGHLPSVDGAENYVSAVALHDLLRRGVAHGIELAMADVQDSIDEYKRCEGGLPLGRAYDDMGEKIAALRGALARLAALKGGA